MVGVRQCTVCYLELGRKKPSLGVAVRIASLSGGMVPVDSWALESALGHRSSMDRRGPESTPPEAA